MDVQVGDVIQTKKPHPCGANRFEIMLPRAKIERNIKKVLRTGEQ